MSQTTWDIGLASPTSAASAVKPTTPKAEKAKRVKAIAAIPTELPYKAQAKTAAKPTPTPTQVKVHPKPAGVTNYNPLPDINLLRQGDEAAWNAAFELLWPVAYRTATKWRASFPPEEVGDVAIEAIREAVKDVQAGKVGSFGDLESLTKVIALRRAVDLNRRMGAKRRAAGMTETLEGLEELVSSDPGPLERVDANELAKLLTGLMVRLPERQRKLLKGYYLYCLKQADLAKAFGMPIGTVSVTLSRALESMLEELRKQPQLMKEFVERLR